MTNERIGPESLVPGYQHIVQDTDYLGGQPALLDRRLSVAQILEELSYGISIAELRDLYSLPDGVIEEALRFASSSITKVSA
jgi:uncharacterized protein (DUF433 family)